MKKKFREELATARAEIRWITESLHRQRTWTHAQEAQHQLQRVEDSVSQHTRASLETVPVESLEAGDIVEIANLDTLGRLLEKPEGKKSVRVQVGESEMSVHVDRLVGLGKGEGIPDAVSRSAQPAPRSSKPGPPLSKAGRTIGSTSSGFTGIDLRGQTAEEALEQLTSQLDQALLRNAKSVRIIHGHGTGKAQGRDSTISGAVGLRGRRFDREQRRKAATGVTMAELT